MTAKSRPVLVLAVPEPDDARALPSSDIRPPSSALRHLTSLDLDFFTTLHFEPAALASHLGIGYESITGQAEGTLQLRINDVKVEFFKHAYGTSMAVNELAARIISLSGSSSDITHLPERPGDVRHSRASIDRLLATGFVHVNSLDQGLAETLAYFSRGEARSCTHSGPRIRGSHAQPRGNPSHGRTPIHGTIHAHLPPPLRPTRPPAPTSTSDIRIPVPSP